VTARDQANTELRRAD